MSPSFFIDYSQRAFWPDPSFAESAGEYLARVKASDSEKVAALDAWRRGLDAAWARWKEEAHQRMVERIGSDLREMQLIPEEP